jgi:hypothetical protein
MADSARLFRKIKIEAFWHSTYSSIGNIAQTLTAFGSQSIMK